jgi:hypothetical protein
MSIREQSLWLTGERHLICSVCHRERAQRHLLLTNTMDLSYIPTIDPDNELDEHQGTVLWWLPIYMHICTGAGKRLFKFKRMQATHVPETVTNHAQGTSSFSEHEEAQ